MIRISAASLEVAANATEAASNALERSLLAKAFRGELVPQDPSDAPADLGLHVAAPATAPKAASAKRRKAAASRGARQEEA